MNTPELHCKRLNSPHFHAPFVGTWWAAWVLLCLCLATLGHISVASAQETETPGPSSAPSVLTERSDYAPGETAVISGSGFASGESVLLQVLHADGTPDSGNDHLPWTVTADAQGSFQATWHVCEDDCLGATLQLSAVGQTSGLSAQSFFTDAGPGCLAGEVDLTDPGSGLNGSVFSFAVQSDGKMLIGGSFTFAGGLARNFIARLTANGSTDNTFLDGLAGANSLVDALSVQPDGKVLIGGFFSTVNGVTRNRIARLNADGTLDTVFQDGLAGASGGIRCVALQSDGKILIGGDFTTVNGMTRNRVARLNADGSLDTTFQNGMTGTDNIVRSVRLQADGKIVIGGDFSIVNGTTRNRVARLNPDGSLDTIFQIDPAGPNGTIQSVAIQSDGKVLLGGEFTSVNGLSRSRVARLNTDGSVDTTFQNALSGANSSVFSVAVQPDGLVLIAGNFSTVNGASRTRIARLNTDGTLDAGLNPNLNNEVDAMVLQPDGKILVGGALTTINGVARNFVGRLNANGSLDATFQNGLTGANSSVRAVVVQSDGKVLMGGLFSSFNGVTHNSIARIASDGSLDNTFQNGLPGANGAVVSLALQSDGKVLLGGGFSAVNAVTRIGIARLNADGSLDTSFLNGLPGANSQVQSLAVQSDGKVLLAGFFTTVNGVSRNRIARLNTDGSLDTSFLNGMTGASDGIFVMAVQPDGKVVIGGQFTSVNGATRNSIARLNIDGSLDTAFQNGMTGANNPIWSVALQSDGKVVVGGDFTAINGVARTRIARLNLDGSLDTTFQNGLPGANNTVFSMSVQSGGKVLLAGAFSSVNGVARSRVARLNPDGSLDTAFQNGLAGANNTVYSLAEQSDGKFVIGGDFTSMNGVPRDHVARLTGAVLDNTPPVVPSLPTLTGQCFITVTAPTATDNCAGTVTGTTVDPLVYNTQGTFTVHWTFNDANGNTSTANQTVIVKDTIAPIAPVLVTITAECSATVPVPTATDNCAGTVTGTTGDPLVYNTQGTFTVHWTFNDGNGNTSTANQSVIVKDTVAPAAPLLDTVTGECSATVPVPTTTDTCAGTVTGTTSDPLVYNTQGTFTVHWTFNDGNGNTSTANQTVIVKDTIAPIAPVLVTITAECSATVPVPTATDNCAGTVTGTTSDPLVYNTQGTFAVHWIFNDGNGNISTANQTVIVKDTVAPATPLLATVTGECSATVPVPTATDNCAGTVTGTTSDPLVYNTQGTFAVHWTFNDANGNTSTANQTVIVKDTIAPIAPVLVTITAECSATVPVPTATDNCAGTVTGTTSDPLVYNTQGTFTVHWTFNDGNGNSSTANQTVIVKDTVAPAAPLLATVTGECSATVPVPTATDNCAGTVTGTTSDPLVYNTQGTFTVHWTFNDGNGNTSTANQSVIIKDTVAPAAPLLATVTGECSATVPVPTATDNCAGTVTGTTTDPLIYNTQGTFTVHWTFNDGHGNTAIANQTVIVKDLTPPTITCPANLFVGCSVGRLAAVNYPAPGVSDNCDAHPTLTCTPPSGSASFAVGANTVTCTATDSAGKTATCSFTVTRAALGFTGFLAPIGGEVGNGTGGSYVDPVRAFKLGSTIPVKFQADCSGGPVSTGAHTLQIAKYSNSVDSDPPIDATPTDAATTGNLFLLTDAASGEWHYNLNTKPLSVGTWKLTAMLSDGTVHEVWITIKK